MFGKIKFHEVGRNKFCGIVEIKNEDHFWEEIRKHLMSNHLEYYYDCKTNHGKILAGIREVGSFSIVQNG
jgi:hypothetical protein